MIKFCNKVNILFLIPSLVGGGAERTLLNILNKLDYNSFKVTLVVVCYTGVYVDQIPQNVNVVPLFKSEFFTRVLSLLQKKFNFTYFFKRKIEKLCSYKYDTAISFLDSNFTDLLFYLPDARKKITWVHSSYKSNNNFYKFYSNKNYRKKIIDNRYSRLDEIIFVSEDAKDEFVSLFGEFNSMPVIYNLLDESSVKIKADEFNVVNNDNKIIFVAIGSLYPVKGYDYLIDAAKILSDENLSFEIHIFGQGFLKDELEERINKYGLSDSVILKGFVKNPYPYIKNSDVFIMTSLSEAMPMALCESLLLNKPVLVTDCSGCREVVGYGKYGLMVGQKSTEIAEGMRKFILDKEELKNFAKKGEVRALDFGDMNILNKINKHLQY